MYEGAQYIDDDVEEMSSQEHQHGHHGSYRSRSHEHLGDGVDNHGDNACGQAQRKDSGVAQEVTHVTADVVEAEQASHQLGRNALLAAPACQHDDDSACDGQVLANRSRHEGHAEEAREHDEPADFVTEGPEDIPVPDEHVGFQQHAADQVQDAKPEAEGQHLQRFLHGHEEQRVQLQSEPASEEGAPDDGGDAAEEDDHGQLAAKALGLHQFQGDHQADGEHQAVARVREHHAEEDKVEGGHQEVRVDTARLRPGVKFDNRFIGFDEGIVFQLGRRNLSLLRIPEFDLVRVRRTAYGSFYLDCAIFPHPAFQIKGFFCFRAAVGQAFFLGRQLVVIQLKFCLAFGNLFGFCLQLVGI